MSNPLYFYNLRAKHAKRAQGANIPRETVFHYNARASLFGLYHICLW